MRSDHDGYPYPIGLVLYKNQEYYLYNFNLKKLNMKIIYFFKNEPKRCGTNNTATICLRLATVHNLYSQLDFPLAIV